MTRNPLVPHCKWWTILLHNGHLLKGNVLHNFHVFFPEATFINLGTVYNQLRQYEKAESWFYQAINLKGGTPEREDVWNLAICNLGGVDLSYHHTSCFPPPPNTKLKIDDIVNDSNQA